MSADNHDTHSSTSDGPLAAEDDARLREVLLSLPVSATRAKLEYRVLAKVRRRRRVIRTTCTASLIMLLTAGWFLLTSDRDPRQSKIVVKDPPSRDSINSVEEFELFASAYQGLASPVIQLETLENESQALLSYLSALEAVKEKK